MTQRSLNFLLFFKKESVKFYSAAHRHIFLWLNHPHFNLENFSIKPLCWGFLFKR